MDLQFLRVDLRMSRTHNEGDVVEQLIRYSRRSNIQYKNLYEEQVEVTKRWKSRFDFVCNKHNDDGKEIMKIEFR